MDFQHTCGTHDSKRGTHNATRGMHDANRGMHGIHATSKTHCNYYVRSNVQTDHTSGTDCAGGVHGTHDARSGLVWGACVLDPPYDMCQAIVEKHVRWGIVGVVYGTVVKW